MIFGTNRFFPTNQFAISRPRGLPHRRNAGLSGAAHLSRIVDCTFEKILDCTFQRIAAADFTPGIRPLQLLLGSVQLVPGEPYFSSYFKSYFMP